MTGFFDDEIRDLMDMVLRDMYMLDKEIEDNFGFTSSRIYTLLAFCRKEVMKMRELSEEMSLKTSTMTRMIDNLVKEGLVERMNDPNDRRLVIVSLTIEGKILANNIKEYKEKSLNSILDNIEKEGKVEMVSSLKILLEAFGKFRPKFLVFTLILVIF